MRKRKVLYDYIGRTADKNNIINAINSEKKRIVSISGPNNIGKTDLFALIRDENEDAWKKEKKCIISRGIDKSESCLDENWIGGYWYNVTDLFWKGYVDYLRDYDIEKYMGIRRHEIDKTIPVEQVEINAIRDNLKNRPSVKEIGKEVIKLCNHYKEKLGFTFVIEFDEFDDIDGASAEFYKIIMQLIEENALTMVLISRQQLERLCPNEIRADFCKEREQLVRIRLKGFSDTEFSEYNQKHWEWKSFSEEVREEIINYCGRHPGLLNAMKNGITGRENLSGEDITNLAKRKEQDKKSESDRSNIERIYKRLYDLMGNDRCFEESDVSYQELFLRVFDDRYDYSDSDKEKWGNLLIEAGYAYEEDGKAVAAAPYMAKYVVELWEKELDKFMVKLDKLEVGIRERLSEKILEFHTDMIDASGNLITKEEIAGNEIRGIWGIRNKNDQMDKMWFEYVANHQKFPREYIYELDSLAFPDYLEIMDKYWMQPHFESLTSDFDKDTYATLMKNIDGLFKDINDYTVSIPSSVSSHFTLPINNRVLRNLTKEKALLLCENNLVPITFSRLRNIAKHRNNLRILNPEIYKLANEYCDIMLEDLKEERALLRMKSIPASVKNTIDTADEFMFIVTKELNIGTKYEGYTNVDGLYYKIIINCNGMVLGVGETYVITRGAVLIDYGIKTDSFRQQYLEIGLAFGKAKLLAANIICTEAYIKNEFSTADKYRFTVTAKNKIGTEHLGEFEINNRKYKAKLIVPRNNAVELQENETYLINSYSLEETIDFSEGFVKRNLKNNAICREEEISVCVENRSEAEELTKLSGDFLCEKIMEEPEICFEIKDNRMNDEKNAKKSGRYIARFSLNGLFFETVIINSSVNFERKKTYVFSKGCYQIEYNVNDHLQVILYDTVLGENNQLLIADKPEEVQNRIISKAALFFKLKFLTKNKHIYFGKIFETEEASEGYFAKLSGNICSNVAINEMYKLPEDIAKKVTYDTSTGMFCISLANEMVKLVGNEIVGIDAPSIAESVEVPKKELRITIKTKNDENHYCGIINWNNGSKQFAANIEFTPKEPGVELTPGVCYKFSSKCIDKGNYMPQEDRREFELVVTDALVEPDNTIIKYKEPPKQEKKPTESKAEPPKPEITIVLPEIGQYYILTLDKNKGVLKKSETVLTNPVAVSVTDNNVKLNALDKKLVKVISIDAKEIKIQKADPVITKFIGGVCKQDGADAGEMERQLDEWITSLSKTEKDLLSKYDNENATLDDLKKVLDELKAVELCKRFSGDMEDSALKEWISGLGDAKNVLLNCRKTKVSLEVLKHWKTVYEAYVVSVGKKEEFINWLNTNVTETQLELLTECSLKNPSLDALKVWIRWMPNVTQEDLSLAKSCDLENVKSPKELSAWLDDKKAAALAEAAATTEP